jgi:hypothetical protein
MEEPTPQTMPTDEAKRAALLFRCRAALDLMPSGSVFSHLTAAALHRLPLSYRMEEDERLHVMRPIPFQRIRQPGIVGHRALHPRQVVLVDGLPVVGLADTWADLGELIGPGKPVGLDDTIVLGDAVATRLGKVTPLRAALSSRVRPRGKRTLVEALGLIRVGSWSPRETQTRIMFVRVGLPEPLPNQPVYLSTDPEQLLGIPDHSWWIKRPDPLPDIKVAGEYQGRAFHSSPAQRAYDLRRRKSFEDDDWIVEWMWDTDLDGTAARSATVVRFANATQTPISSLDLGACEPRFFSQYAMDQARQRTDRWLHRFSA